MDAVFEAAGRWAKAEGGKAIVAEDPQHSIDLIVADQSGGLVAAVSWGGDGASDESREPSGSLLEGVVNVALSRPLSLDAGKGKAIARTLDLCHGLREAVTGIDHAKADWLQRPPRYSGKTPVAVRGDRLLNGYLLRFTVTYLRGDPED